MLAEELIDSISKGIRVLSIDVNYQRRMLRVAVLNHERDILEFVRLPIRLKLIGDLVGQVVEYLNRFLCHRLYFGFGRLCHRERVKKT
ncbi:hypothetical protein GCM10009000_033430 [Halobacterium noricense]